METSTIPGVPPFLKYEEPPTDYVHGGYHPVRIGDCYGAGRYRVIAKLGWGHFSTVWLAEDTTLRCRVALKIIRSLPAFTRAAIDEIALLSSIAKRQSSPKRGGLFARESADYVVQLIDDFMIHGPNGKHICMVFREYAYNLYTLIRFFNYRGLPLPLVRCFARQLLFGMASLHDMSIIHTDLKPENVVLNRYPSLKYRAAGPSDDPQVEVVVSFSGSRGAVLRAFGDTGAFRCTIVDLGNACWADRRLTQHVQTRQYRAPEVILRSPNYDAAIDIWSFACLIFELITGDVLFDPEASAGISRDDDHLAKMAQVIGPAPPNFVRRLDPDRRVFDEWGRPLRKRCRGGLSMRSLLRTRLSRSDADIVASFLLEALTFCPRERATARSLLRHPWLKHVSEDDLDSCF